MSFWKTLGKAILTGGAAAAAPFTGGTSMAALPAILGGAGAVVGGMGSAATSNRGQQDVLNISRDQIGLRAREGDENAELQRALLELKQREDARAAEQDAYKNAMRSSLAMNMQDASFSRPAGIPTMSFSGGARPSAIGPQGREAAAMLNNRAMQQVMSGPAPAMQMSERQPFQQSEPSKASFWEKLAGPVGMGLTLASMGLDAKNKGEVPMQMGGPQFPQFQTPLLGQIPPPPPPMPQPGFTPNYTPPRFG
jgi:hypothetical protein